MRLGRIIIILFVTVIIYTQPASAASIGRTIWTLIVGKEKDITKAPEQWENMPLDYVTKDCLSCHSGELASDVHAPRIGAGFRQKSNHPIGMMYESSAMKKPMEYVPLSQLNRNIILENGRVTCISCHLLKKPGQNNGQMAQSEPGGDISLRCTSTKYLTVSYEGSNLCISCHRK